MKKRGLSTVIASIIIILLALVIGGIVWFTVKNVLIEDSKKVSLTGLTVDLDIKSLRTTEDTIVAKIKRNPGDGNLLGLKFIVFDGTQSYEFERMNVNLDPLQIKTFILNYSGYFETFSVYPIFESDTGSIVIGGVSDTYYNADSGAGGEGTGDGGNCTGDCGIRECGLVPNGCGTSCGSCSDPSYPFCDDGVCTNTPCTPGCSCASTTCADDLCLGGCQEVCLGTITDDCNLVDCGPAPNGCNDDCGICESEYHCDAGVCVVDCVVNCTGLECGLDPECGASCGSCDIPAGEWCDNGICSNNTCVANCSGRVCGVDPLCGDLCPPGCNVSIGEWCNEDGECLTGQYINNGTVFSIWPITIGIYFDSSDLPKSGVDYTDYYARFPGSLELRCLQIREYVIPVIPEVYNLSHVRFVTSSTAIQPNDQYEIWENYVGCINA